VKALHDEGLTMDRIAVLFGLTRQRISSLLKEGSELRVEGRLAVGRPGKGTAAPGP
jgi:hypothetical protein